MQPNSQTANVLANNEAPYENEGFSVIMELTKEEKAELIRIWRSKEVK